MTDPLGLSVGAANLVAARAAGIPVARKAVLTLFDHRRSEIGEPDDRPHPTERGRVLRGFVERVGDRTPLVAPDGTTYRAEALTAEALDAMARTAGCGAPVTIAVPAYWSADQAALVRDALFTHPALTTPGGVPPVTIPDATAALAALHSKPGFPTAGVVAVCDFGASGTSVTLTDAASNFQQIGRSVRYGDFSGDRIDQLILRSLQTGGADSDNADGAETDPMGSLSRRFDECRRAKEQLSAATMTVVPAEMPGFGQDLRLSRRQFEQMISGPLDQFVDAFEEILQRNAIPRANLAAIATVGGGASIPLITACLSERLDVPIFTTPQPASSAAIGAAMLGRQRSSPAVPTAAGPVVDAPTEQVPAGWAIQAAGEAAGESSVDDNHSATYRALAWSQDTSADADPIAYAVAEGGDDAIEPEDPVVAPMSPWYSRAAFQIGLTGAAAVALVGIIVAAAFKLTTSKSPTEAPSNVTAPVGSTAIQQSSELPSPTPTAPSPTASWVPPTSTEMTTAPATTNWETTRPSPTTTPPTTTWTTTTLPSTTLPSTTAPTWSTYPSSTAPWPTTTAPRRTVTLEPTTALGTPPWGY